MSRGVLRSLALWTGVFALVALPWLRVATHAAPAGYLHNAPDEWLVPWILAWVAHALATDPGHVLDANLNWPAPRQLAGIEHFASTQLIFAPVFWATGNAILATNVVTFLSYPLAAVAMERLLLALGCARVAAVVGGFVFALGPLRVPGNFMVVKYLNLYFPLIALALTRLRDRSTLGHAALVGAVTAAALFSSYYLAVMALFAAGVWAAFELFRPAPGRVRFVLLAAGATGAAVLLLAVASRAYLARPEAAAVDSPSTSQLALAFYAIPAREYLASGGRLPAVLAALGALGLLVPGGARRTFARGLVLVLVAHVLMVGPARNLNGTLVPLPYAAFAATPLRFFRSPARFVVLLGFGAALLAGAGLDVVARRLDRRGGALAVGAAGAAVLATRGLLLVGPSFEQFEPQTARIYDFVRSAALDQREGLLELPSIPGNFDRRRFPHGTEVEALLGSTRHWQPLVTGCHGCYPPPHAAVLADVLRRLPSSAALEDLVDLTHLRWIVLRPQAEWDRAGLGDQRKAYLNLARVTPVRASDGWLLLRVDRPVRHPAWFTALAAGWRPGQTVFGTPLAPLPAEGVRSTIAAPTVPGAPLAGWPLLLEVSIANLGTAAWPVVVPRDVPPAHTVGLRARWWPGRKDGEPVAQQDIALWRDVAPADVVLQQLILATPTAPGDYELEIAARQDAGPPFPPAANPPLALRLALVAPR